MRLLDLFCCQGGAARGYADAGWTVTGVDMKPQKRYPYAFHQADALAFLAEHWREFDAIHASPPCQRYSVTRHTHTVDHPDLVAPTREALKATGLPYIIENVPGAPLVTPITLCGAAFRLTTTDDDGSLLVLRRHRLFESNVWLTPVECDCLIYKDRGYQIAGVYGAGARSKDAAKRRRGGYTPAKAQAERLLGIDWMSELGLRQAIPPAYTRYLGAELAAALQTTPPAPVPDGLLPAGEQLTLPVE